MHAPLAGVALRRLWWDVAVPAWQRQPEAVTVSRLQALRAFGRFPQDPAVRRAMAEALGERSPQELDALARSEARNRWLERLEQARFATWTAASVRHHVRLAGREVLEGVLAGGRGVILAAAHFGVHGLPPLALTLLGYPIVARTFVRSAERLGPGGAYGQARRLAYEESLPVRWQRTDRPSDPLGVLAEGGALLTAGDGLGPHEVLGEPLEVRELAGHRTFWPQEPWRLAEASGVPVLGLYPATEGHRHRLVVEPVPHLDAFVARYEQFLRSHPADWQFWARWHPGELRPA